MKHPRPDINKKAAGLLQGNGGRETLQAGLYPPDASASPGGVLELAAGLDALEYATVSAVLAIHPAGIAQAEQASLKAEMIQAPDLRLIFEACQTTRDSENID